VELQLEKVSLTLKTAEIVDLLLSAGAIIMGKTATSELAYSWSFKNYKPP
jgi:Asp-tRNA(Asn)/Glu-tRNA(Gln) amidotransferase A subunit family amidase